MNPRSLLWGGVAAVEAIAIAVLLWLLLGEGTTPTPPQQQTAPARSSSPSPTANPSAEAGSSTHVASSASSPSTVSPTVEFEAMATLVHGTVSVADDGEPPGYTRLTLTLEGDSDITRKTELGREQRWFAWPDVPPGRYQLAAYASGMRDHKQLVEITDSAFDVRADVVLEPKWTIDVLLLTPDGRPLAEALQALPQGPALRHEVADSLQVIALWQEIPDALPYSDLRSTDLTVASWRSALAGGPSELPPRCAGQLEMPERRAAFVALVLKEAVLARGRLNADQDELTMTLDPARMLGALSGLRLQVVDTNGAPLTAATVGINDAQSWRPPTPVDAAGRVAFVDHLPGQFHLDIDCDGFAPLRCAVVMPSSTVVDIGALQLQPAQETRIEIVDPPDGAKLSGWLIPLDPPPHANLSALPQPLRIRDGKAQAQLAAGRHRLLLSGAGGATMEFDTRQLGKAPLTVTLRPEAKLKIDSSAVSQPTRLLVQYADGNTVLDRWVRWQGIWARDLLPGTYRVTIQPLGGASRTNSFDLPAHGATLRL